MGTRRKEFVTDFFTRTEMILYASPFRSSLISNNLFSDHLPLCKIKRITRNYERKQTVAVCTYSYIFTATVHDAYVF